MQLGGPHIETFCLPGQSRACLGSALNHRARNNAERQSVVDHGRDTRLVPTTHCGRLTVSSYVRDQSLRTPSQTDTLQITVEDSF